MDLPIKRDIDTKHDGEKYVYTTVPGSSWILNDKRTWNKELGTRSQPSSTLWDWVRKRIFGLKRRRLNRVPCESSRISFNQQK